MRLLQLPTGRDELLDLHPNVTVVQGLDDASHRLLIDAITGLARGEGVQSGGLLEAHGVLFEMRTDLLQLLHRSTEPFDPVVRASDLPTQPLTVDARELRTREREFTEVLARISAQAERQSQARDAAASAAAAVDRARRARAEAEAGAEGRIEQVDALTRRLDQLAELRRRLEVQLGELLPEKERAEAARREVEERTAGVRTAARDALSRQAALEAERDALVRDLDPDATAAVDRAQEELRGVLAAIAAERSQRAAAGVPVGTPAHTRDRAVDVEPPAVRLDRLEARLKELDHTLVATAPVSSWEVADALALLQGGDSAEKVPSPEAHALADALDDVALEIGDATADPVPEGSLTEARERLDDARQALLEAEQGVRNPELDRDEVDRLEDAHEALLNAIDKADGRFASSRAKARVSELRDAEQEVLDRLGFASYSDYMMGSSLLHVDPEKEAALDAARQALAAAEDDWRRLREATDHALAMASVFDRRRGLIERARKLLGAPVPDADLPVALRDLLVPAVSAEESAGRLQVALARVGLELGDEDLDHVELGMIADAWLAEVAAADSRRPAAEQERRELEDELWALRAEVASMEVVEDEAFEPDPEEGWAARHAAAQARVDEAEERWLVHEMAAERLAALVPDLEAATAAASLAVDTARDAEQEVADASGVVDEVLAREQAVQNELDRAAAEEGDAAGSLRALTTDPSHDPVVLAAGVDAAEAALREAEDGVETESRALSLLDAEGQATAIEIERLQDIVAAQGAGTSTEAEELEWYLLARLAAQRSVSVAGSLPLLLDDALRGLDGPGVDHLLGRLERMAEAVQVIIVSEDPFVASWAQEAGSGRAAVVRPGVA